MRVENDIKLDFEDVLIRPKRSTLTSRSDVILERTFKFLHSPKVWSGIPICAANMDSCGTFEMARALSKHKMITALHKYYSIDELIHNLPTLPAAYLALTFGIRDEDYQKLEHIKKLGLDKHFDFLILDVPNGYLTRFVDALKLARKLLPDHIIIAGNVVTNEMTEELLLEGADIVKVGIGSGSACLTRRKAGVGYPQLSAVIECADAAHGISKTGCGLIMSDGGKVHPACVAKAFCWGADFVMSGTLFSGYDESAGEKIVKDGVTYKEYFGSSSSVALTKHYGSIANHRTSEGRYILMKYKGSVHDFVQDLCGSLRSTATYIGARTLKEFNKRTTFIRVNRQLNQIHEKDTVSS
jgi:GMP reductase